MLRLAFLAPLALALICALAPAARASNVKPRIVNGGSVLDIAQRPYQVALWDPAAGDPNSGQFCGGAILDATHVVTAAHCLVDSGNALGSPRAVNVLAGTNDLTLTSGADVKDIPAATLSIDAGYDPGTHDHDVGIVELASPLWDTSGPAPTIDGVNKIAPIPLVDGPTFDGWLANAGTTTVTATVSGWGDTNAEPAGGAGSPSFPSVLQTVDIPLIPEDTCAAAFAADPFKTQITGTTLFCAGVDDADPSTDPTHNRDACQGDSGGPLAISSNQTTPAPPDDFVLAGLVDSGFGCAQQNLPGIYTSVSGVSGFISASEPSLLSAPTAGTSAQVGQTLTCSPGTWTGSPSFLYRFYRETGGDPIPISTQAADPTFTLPPSTANGRVFCEVQAEQAPVQRTADSADVTVAPVPSPPPVQPPPPPPPPPVVDSTAPKLRVVSKRCTKTSCTVKVHVADAAPSSGIGTLKATLGWTKRVKCRARGRHSTRPARTCRKRVHRTLHAKAGRGGNFTIVAKHLNPGTSYTFTLVPFDRAGNRPRFSTITNVRTKSRHSSGLLL
jgi:secreted trypsin-like serine protease